MNREVIVTAALELVRDEGIAALTMRRVAELLDVSAMSLYRHLADRQALLIGMLDAVAHTIRPAPPNPSAKTELADILTALHETFFEYPWVVGVLASDGLASEHIMPLMNQAYDCLLRSGLTEDEAVQGWLILFHYLVGESLFAHQTTPSYAQQMVRTMDLSELPVLSRLIAHAGHTSPESSFGVNLQKLLNSVLPADS